MVIYLGTSVASLFRQATRLITVGWINEVWSPLLWVEWDRLPVIYDWVRSLSCDFMIECDRGFVACKCDRFTVILWLSAIVVLLFLKSAIAFLWFMIECDRGLVVFEKCDRFLVIYDWVRSGSCCFWKMRSLSCYDWVRSRSFCFWCQESSATI